MGSSGIAAWASSLLAAAAALLLSACEEQKAAPPPPPPPVVEVVDVLQKEVPIRAEWVATTDGFVNARIRAEVQGYLLKQDYREGDFVKKGKLLFEIDAGPYEAALAQANASLKLATAALEQAKAAVEQAKTSVEQAKATRDQAKAEVVKQEAQYFVADANLKRIKPLAAQKAVSQKDLDDALGAERSARAAVVAAQAQVGAAQAKVGEAQAKVGVAEAAAGAAQAQIGVAQAAVDKAKLDCDFTHITSPINGIAGTATAQVGDLVGPAQTGELATVSTVDPIKVYFPVSEEYYVERMKRLAEEFSVGKPAGAAQRPEAGGTRPEGSPPAASASPDGAAHANNGAEPVLELLLADGKVFPHKGTFYAIDRQVDPRTGTIRVAVTFPNPGNLLRPGQFVRIRVTREAKRVALLVPQQAVMELQGMEQVAVVKPDNTVEIRNVRTGERVGPLWVIERGLKPGERIVAEGVQKVRQGIEVNPKPYPPATEKQKE